jgi:hypothetical protein
MATLGCDLAPSETPDPPPLRIRALSVETAPVDGTGDGDEAAASSKTADETCNAPLALRADLENTSEHSIVSFTAHVSLVESQSGTGNVGPAPDMEWKNEIPISAGAREVFCVPLDAFHLGPVADPPRLARFHLKQVRFGDGTNWKDPLAVYAWRAPGQEDT